MKLRNQSQAGRSHENCMRAVTGFVFIELLVVIAIIALLAAMLLPTLSRARQQAAAIQCLNNLKELALAWNMYVADNHGVFPYNEEPGNVGWIAGGEMNYSGSNDDTNLLDLTGPHSQIGPYVLKQPLIFKCPADKSRSFGMRGTPRIRTYSMSASIGLAANGTPSGQGYWLPSIYNGGPWMCYFKESDLSRPGPSMLWLFQEEDPDSINDAAWQFNMPTMTDTAWIDSPSKLHGNAGRFAFVDGHSEVHTWHNPLAVPNVTYSGDGGDPVSYPRKVINGNVDVWWVAARTSALASGAQNDFPSD